MIKELKINDFKLSNDKKITLELLETKLRFKLPQLYRELLLKYNNFAINGSELLFGYGFKLNGNNDLVVNNLELEKEKSKRDFKNMPFNIVPIMPNGDGSLWALNYNDLNKYNEPKVYYLELELSKIDSDTDFKYLSEYFDSFEDFVNYLNSDE